jgi:hypothetical protein
MGLSTLASTKIKKGQKQAKNRRNIRRWKPACIWSRRWSEAAKRGRYLLYFLPGIGYVQGYL